MGTDEGEPEKLQHAKDCIGEYAAKQGEEQSYRKREGENKESEGTHVGLMNAGDERAALEDKDAHKSEVLSSKPSEGYII